MNDIVETNGFATVAQIFSGKNGPILGGILGIVGLVGMYYLVNSEYRFAGTTSNGGFTIEPAYTKTPENTVEVSESNENVETEGEA